MASVTGNQVVQGAFSLLNVFLPGETPDANNAQYGLSVLNDLLSLWSQETLMIPVIARERFDLVANQGGPDNPYTIGPGGDFDTERPSNQTSITAANLILATTSPEVRVPLGIYTDQAYDANQIPGMSNTQPTSLYYNPTYANDLGSIYLWPVPTVDYNDLELFLQKSVAQFADLVTTQYVPDGVPMMLKYNLARALAGSYGRQLAPSDQQIADKSLGIYRRSNTKLFDLLNDASFGPNRNTIFNINTGQ